MSTHRSTLATAAACVALTLLLLTLPAQAQIVSYPWVEDFDTFGVGTPGTLQNGWQQEPVADTFDWTVHTGTTSSLDTGPSGDHTSGAGIYLYIETSSPRVAGDVAHLLSPDLDLSTLVAPRVEFYYHMYGATIATLSLDVYDGTAWTNDVWTLTGQQQTAESDPYLSSGPVDLAPFVAPGPSRLRFRASVGSSYTGDIAIDDVRVFDASAPDVAVVSVDTPTSGCGLSASEVVSVTLENRCLTTAAGSFPITWTCAGPVPQGPVTETMGLSIAPGGTVTFTFAGTVDLSTPGSYTIDVTAALPGDVDPGNDTATGSPVSIPTIATFPYTEDFESGAGGWVASGALNSWQLGTPAAAVINAPAPGGSSSWVTNLVGDYNNSEQSQVLSPCMDFTTLAIPHITLDIWWESEFSWDGAVLQTSTDAGATWQNVGALGDPYNWYTDDTIAGNPGGQQEGWSGTVAGGTGSAGWVTAQHNLTGLGGHPGVLLRIAFGSDGSVQEEGVAFDNIVIQEAPPNPDVGVVSIDAPVSGCLGAAEIVTVTLENNNSAGPATGFSITYDLTGPVPPGPVAETVGVSVPSGGTASFSFVAPADLSTPGVYTLTVTTALVGDTNPANDSLTTSVDSGVLVASFPYLEDFETFVAPSTLQNGWVQEGLLDQDDWTVDSGGTSSSGTGPLVDHTTGSATGIYLYYETSGPAVGDETWLYSPCFDVGSLSAPMTSFWYHMHGADMGTLHLDVQSGGVWVNDVFTLVGQQQPAQADPYLWSGPIDLTPFGSQVRLRFRGECGTSFTSDMAIDDVEVRDGDVPDVGVVSIDAPITGCGLGPAETITVTLLNNNIITPATSFPVQYTVTGPVSAGPHTETIAVTVPPAGTASFSFATPADFSVLGTYTVDVITLLPGDVNPANDMATATVESLPVIAVFPYLEDFEGGAGGWLDSGVNNSWQLGTPANPVISAPAPGGTSSWMTNLVGDYNMNEQSEVRSPCFDLSTLSLPWVSLDIWWNAEFSWDGAVLQYSTDGGLTWPNVGAFGDPNNWYTDDTINGNPGGQQEGWTGRDASGNGSGGWVTAYHEVPVLAGQPSVFLRVAFGSDGSIADDGFAFDNVIVRESPPQTTVDTGAFSPTPPVLAQDLDTDVHLVQVEMTAALGADALVTMDLVASGTGNDQTGVAQVRVVHEDQLSLNGIFDGGDTVVFTGTYAADDGTLTASFAPQIPLPLGQLESFLVLYDFTASAAGALPPSTYDVTVSNVQTTGVVLTPTGDPVGGALVDTPPQLRFSAAPAAARSIDHDALGEVALAVTADARWVAAEFDALTVAASGTGNDQTALLDVHLYEDTDGSGTLTPGDVLLSSAGGGYPADDGTLVLGTGSPIALVGGATVDLLVVYDLAGTALAGETFQATLTGATIVTPPGHPLGGLPVPGDLLAINTPVLTVIEGPFHPAPLVHAGNGATGVVLGQLELSAAGSFAELTGFDLQASGSGDDLTGVTQVEFILEDPLSTDGQVDPTDLSMGTSTFGADDGIASYGGAPIQVAPAQNLSLLVVYDFDVGASGGMASATYSWEMVNVSTSGLLNLPGGNPIGGAEVGGCPVSLCGDCNADGSISILDALRAAQANVGLTTLTPEQFSNCNVTGAVEPDPGAAVTILDALAIAQSAAGLGVVLTCCI